MPLAQEGPTGVPAGASALIPRLVCRNPAGEIEFCTEVFGATEVVRRAGPDGAVVHALLKVNGAMLMIEAEWPTLPSRAPQMDGSSPVMIYAYVADVDRTLEHAISHGAELLVPLQDQFWGDRTAWILDPSGHVWTIASRIEDSTPADREARWSALAAEAEDS